MILPSRLVSYRLRLIVCLLCLVFVLGSCTNETERLVLATTTSTNDSGLIDAILPDFERRYDVEVDIVAVGTGEALKLGEAGDVDVVMVHARAREDAFVAAGFGVDRRDIMCNDFVLLGPPSDPAMVLQSADFSTALTRIANTQSPFISRGDDSGTHIRELALWAAANIDPAPPWYQSVGQGMGPTLTLAAEQRAYVLSDRGTYLNRNSADFDLTIVAAGDPQLLNPYGIIAVNPDRHPSVNYDAALTFIDWLASPDTQMAINAYRVNGEQLFHANPDNPADCIGGSNTVSVQQSDDANPLAAAFALIFNGDRGLWEIVALSLLVSGVAVAIAAVLGVPLGAWLGLRNVAGQRWLTALIYTGMGFPPVVVGLVVYLLLSREGLFGRLEWLLTPTAMILAQTILALPLIIGVTMSAVQAVDVNLRAQLRALGATERQVIQATLTEARQGVIVGLVAGFGAAISEVGAVMLVGGNILGRTRVLTTAIVLETRQGNFDIALALGIILLALALVINALMVMMQARRK